MFCFSLSGPHLGSFFCGSSHPATSSLLLHSQQGRVWEGAVSLGTQGEVLGTREAFSRSESQPGFPG